MAQGCAERVRTPADAGHLPLLFLFCFCAIPSLVPSPRYFDGRGFGGIGCLASVRGASSQVAPCAGVPAQIPTAGKLTEVSSSLIEHAWCLRGRASTLGPSFFVTGPGGCGPVCGAERLAVSSGRTPPADGLRPHAGTSVDWGLFTSTGVFGGVRAGGWGGEGGQREVPAPL